MAGDEGAYLMLYAILAVALFSLGAVVLDIAALRQDRAGDRLAADLAATAGASRLDRAVPASAQAACEDAWAYFLDNVADAIPASGPGCAVAFPPLVCDDTTPATTATGTAGPYTVEITTPVPDGSPLMAAEAPGGNRAQASDPAIDGHQCERMAVQVVRQRQQPFSAVVGLGARTTTVHSVARSSTAVAAGQVTELVVLDPSACGALRVEGTVDVEVAGTGQSGDIGVDSDGTACGGAAEVLAVADTARLRATAGVNPGLIRSVALTGPFPTAAYDPADVSAGRLSPNPSPASSGVGRGAVDQRYNCAAATCPAGAAHINRLRADVGAGVPAAYLGVPVLPYLGPCDAVTPTVIPAGNWYVPCPVFRTSAPTTFEGGLLVVQGAVVVPTGGCFAIGSAACGGAVALPVDSILYLQAGDLTAETGADLSLQRSFVHLSGGAATTGTGRVLLDDPGPTALREWTAPVGGVFEDLGLWAEAGDAMHVEAQPGTVVDGVVFTPNAELRVTPTAGAATLAAQLITGRLRATGSGVLTLSPIPTRAVANTARSVRLLR